MEYIVLILLILISIFISLVIFSFYVAFYVNRKKTIEAKDLPQGYGYKENQEFLEQLTKLASSYNYEEITITSFDGIKLSAKYYHLSDKAPIQILCHGYRGYSLRDMSGGSKLAREFNHNILLIDHRAHGKSGGNTITFGINERKDILSWINYCNKRFGSEKDIILSGVSMGASSVIMALDLDLPKNVVGVIADCPFSSPKEIIIKFTNDLKLPGKLLYPFIYLGCKIIGKTNLHETSAVKAIKNSKIPVLIIHGNKDDLVPYEMSQAIKKANPDMCELHIFENAGHGLSYLVDDKKYKNILIEFNSKIKNPRN